MAISIFAGFVLPSPLALLVPIAAAFTGDLFLGFHDLMWVVYLSLLPMVWLGMRMPALEGKRRLWLGMGLSGFFAAVLFFITTNLAVWWTSGMYPHTQAGLSTCFIMALPFFHNSLLATWAFLGGFEVLRQAQPLAVTKAIN